MVAISLHLLLPISKTTNRPTTSEFLQLLRTCAKFFQFAFFAILYQALRDAPHSLCRTVASRIAFRLTIRMTNLRNLRSGCQPESFSCDYLLIPKSYTGENFAYCHCQNRPCQYGPIKYLRRIRLSPFRTATINRILDK